MAALVAVRWTPGLRGAARELASALARLQTTIAENYLSTDLARRLSEAAPDDRDRQSVTRVAQLVSERTGDQAGDQQDSDQYAAVVVHRSRILLDGLQQWTRGDIDNHEWEG